MRGGRILTAVVVLIALAASGCAVESSPPLTIVAKDFKFEGVPREIRGGTFTATFRNEGKVSHEFALIDIGDASFDDFRKEFPKIIEGGPFPKFFRGGTSAFEIGPGESLTSTISLQAGDYLLFCALEGDPTKPETPEGEEAQGKPHYELGMYKPQVTISGGGGDLEAKDGEIVAKDYSFEVPKTGAGTREFAFRNAGPEQWHHAVVFEFEGIDEQAAVNAFRAFGQAEETGQPPPPGTPEPNEAGFAGIFSPGNGETIKLDLKQGSTYLFVCFIQDKSGGPPHAFAHNMVTPYRVT